MITPLEIQSKEFKKSLIRGYRTKEVDIYLDSVNSNYEKLYKENIELKDKIGILTDQIRQYNNLEETLKSTLVIAQSTADEVNSSARKKAELIIEDAEIQAKNRIDDAREQVKSINIEYNYLKKEIFIFKTRYESFIKAQLLSLESFYKDYENNIAPNTMSVNEELLVENDKTKDEDDLGA